MKPFRAEMVQELMLVNGFDEHFNLFESHDVRFDEITAFHAIEYIIFFENDYT